MTSTGKWSQAPRTARLALAHRQPYSAYSNRQGSNTGIFKYAPPGAVHIQIATGSTHVEEAPARG